MALAALSVLPSITTDLDRLGDELAALAAHLDAATARFLALLREFDARGGWANGFRSCAEWLSWRVGLAPGAAREHVRVARTLGHLPRLTEALARGEVSYSKVRALTRVAAPETEARLLAVARTGTAAHVERIVRGWRRVDAQGEVPDAAARHGRRWLQVYPDEDGMLVVRGRLSPEAGAVLVRALEAAGEALYARRRADAATPAEADPPTHGQRQADALALVAETALAQGLDPVPGQERYQVVVHVDAAVLADPSRPGQAALEDGVSVPAETSRRLACEATRVVMRHAGDGSVLDVGGGRGRSRRRSGGRCRRGTAAVGSRAAGCATPRGTTSGSRAPGGGAPAPRRPEARISSTGRTAGRPGWTTWRCCVAGTTGPSTRRATGSCARPTGRSASARRRGGPFPRRRRRRPCPPTQRRRSSRPTGDRAWRSMRGRRAPRGTASGSISAGRSTSCTPRPIEARTRPPAARRDHPAPENAPGEPR
jgi:hypothetical protein